MVDVVFGVEIESRNIPRFEGEAVYLMGRGQAIVKDDSPLVGAVLYIVRGPRHIEEHGFPFVEDFPSEGGLRQRLPPRLPVGPDLDAVVVGQD